MKNNIPFLILLALIFSYSFEMSCQERIEDFHTLPEDATLYDLVLFSGLNSVTAIKGTKPNSNNNIFITQIGENNYSQLFITAEESNYSFVQAGMGNFTYVDAVVKNFKGKLVQNGNNNYSSTLANDVNMELHFEVNQHGNGNNFISHGVNSIGNKLSFDMTGNSKTILVRNFK